MTKTFLKLNKLDPTIRMDQVSKPASSMEFSLLTVDIKSGLDNSSIEDEVFPGDGGGSYVIFGSDDDEDIPDVKEVGFNDEDGPSIEVGVVDGVQPTDGEHQVVDGGS
ncbi:hypothetical protein LWI29_033695 [Acer saccharum]|uniref:Uncharacterized protein n=1 Tax=Acer saccharum TaxID=4024 RepID=A0AA39S083_ACESA|nr:hypothetical protein LWI29_033695 [Acer saccharum]